MTEIERYWDGHRAAVVESLRRAERAGQLVSYRQLPARPGQVAVLATLRAPAAAQAAPERVWSRGAVAAGAGLGAAVTVACGAAGWAAWVVASWVAAHAAQIAATGLGVLVLLGLAWFGLGRLGACPGIHCPGCGCR